MKTKQVLGYTISFERRRYGSRENGITYTWAFIEIPGKDKRIVLGDPYPAVNWDKKELEQAVKFELVRQKITVTP